MSRPPHMSPQEWRGETKWLKNNREDGLAGNLKPHKQERFNKHYPFSKQYRDSLAEADAFDIEPAESKVVRVVVSRDSI